MTMMQRMVLNVLTFLHSLLKILLVKLSGVMQLKQITKKISTLSMKTQMLKPNMLTHMKLLKVTC
ncbi:gp053b (endogenous virus) [Lactococcus phage KSY1]|uniref:Gp053b n=1 Tax=Lactococcus phage KSY1 TaxID=2913972 RepID=A6MAB8_9CAUD|nr:gp053b [Lactococcus phage KSY1]ABG21596.1 gp053b [Lactococcus phage KSY1]